MEITFDAFCEYEQGQIFRPVHEIPGLSKGKKFRVTITDELAERQNERTGYAKKIAEIIEEINNSDEVLEGEPGELTFSTSEAAKTL